MPLSDSETSDKTGKYRAPALEKGLDVLELLAATKTPMTLSQISTRLDRSVSELFRMVQVLEARGYVAPSSSGEGFELTNKLFSLGISRGPNQNLMLSALPMMQDLSQETRQACHLAIASDDQMVVVARVEAPGDLGFSVRVGYQRHICKSTSGLVLYAFQKPKQRASWRNSLRLGVTPEEWEAFETKAEAALAQGYVSARSGYAEGIIDISCPIANDSSIIAALTMPFIHSTESAGFDETLLLLKDTAQRLSTSLGGFAGTRVTRDLPQG